MLALLLPQTMLGAKHGEAMLRPLKAGAWLPHSIEEER